MSNLILNEPVPNIGVPVLKPTKCTPSLSIETENNNKGWLEWLKNFIPSLFNNPEQGDRPKSDDEGWVDWMKRFTPNLFNQPQLNFKLVHDK